MNDSVDEIARIARAASIPIEHRYIDAATVAAMLDFSVTHFRQRIASKPDFPASKKLGGSMRWNAAEVAAWAAAQPVRPPRAA